METAVDVVVPNLAELLHQVQRDQSEHYDTARDHSLITELMRRLDDTR
ncbi:hypothetical protein [Streptomyces sp. NPDC059970]